MLKLKLEKETGTKNVNELSKKQKKKFSKLINQIAMAEEDLEAAINKFIVKIRLLSYLPLILALSCAFVYSAKLYCDIYSPK